MPAKTRNDSFFVSPNAFGQRGVNAWLDVWEILPGDSLVDKIFNEGLKPADAVIVVLSNASISLSHGFKRN
jgi:hypothetical protein